MTGFHVRLSSAPCILRLLARQVLLPGAKVELEVAPALACLMSYHPFCVVRAESVLWASQPLQLARRYDPRAGLTVLPGISPQPQASTATIREEGPLWDNFGALGNYHLLLRFGMVPVCPALGPPLSRQSSSLPILTTHSPSICCLMIQSPSTLAGVLPCWRNKR
jgi:hypothetical protein